MTIYYIIGGIAAVAVLCLVWFLLRRGSRTASAPDVTAGAAGAIGEKAVVTERIENVAGCGQAEVHGQCWSACALSDEDVYEPGDVVSVVAAVGVRLICKK